MTMRRVSLWVGLALASPAMAQEAKPASDRTRVVLADFARTLPTADREDQALVARGFIATVADGKLRNPDGSVAGDLNTDAFFAQPAPASVNPSLWRNARLLARHGLFKVSERIYQVRGFSISNMTIIVGTSGYIVVDPGYEAAAFTGMQLVYEKLGRKPVTGIIYTHSHTDHYSGVRGVISDAEATQRKVPVVAPKGFVQAVLGEAIIAGPAMARRAGYQFGFPLAVDATGGVTLGIGPNVPTTQNTSPSQVPANRSRLPIIPTQEVSRTGETLTIDGTMFEFQYTPETEAPAEMHFYLPELKALCLAENANGGLHNALPARGALVRDVKAWADALTGAIDLYGARSDVLFTSHFWPRWGRAAIGDYLANHRDAYKYLHDQSVRLMNDGLTGPEIARTIAYPPELAAKWYNREYYGTLSHNSRAVYQRYMGFYDGNPAHLDPLTPVEGARKYVAALGGGARVLELSREAIGKDDHRWAVELLNQLVFAEEGNVAARAVLADLYEQLAYRAESSTWRNGYLVAARELRLPTPAATPVPPFAGLLGLPIGLLLDAAAVRLVPERAKGVALSFVVEDPASGRREAVEVRNSVLVHRQVAAVVPGTPVLRLDDRKFHAALTGQEVPGMTAADRTLVRRFAALFAGPLAPFAIVTP